MVYVKLGSARSSPYLAKLNEARSIFGGRDVRSSSGRALVRNIQINGKSR
jgi:hypothetical protein